MDFGPHSTTGLLCDLGQVPRPLWATVSTFCNARRLGVVDRKGSPSSDPVGFLRSPRWTETSLLSKGLF